MLVMTRVEDTHLRFAGPACCAEGPEAERGGKQRLGPLAENVVGRHVGVEGTQERFRLCAATLAETIGARTLLLLTNVDAVFRDFGTPHQQPLRRLSLEEADALLSGDALGSGSMRPKVEAAADFVRQGGERAVIAELSQGLAALAGRTGTTIAGPGRAA